jgi:hypothetical protein
LQDFPKGSIRECDPLDFIVSGEGAKIGIELIEYLWRNGRVSSIMKMQESMQNRVCSIVSSLYAKQRGPHLNVLLSWNPKAPTLRKMNVSVTAERVTALILANVPNENDTVAIDDELPDGLLAVLLFRKQGLTLTSLGTLRSATDQSISPDEIRRIIHSKENKLSLYRAHDCNELWLLIVAEGAAPSSLAALDLSIRKVAFCSGFDRVYFYDALNGAIVSLKMIRSF